MKALFFKAYYCGICNKVWDEIIEPLIDEGFEFEEIDAMKQPHIAKQYGIKGVPTVVIVRGEIITKLYGRMSIAEIRSKLRGR